MSRKPNRIVWGALALVGVVLIAVLGIYFGKIVPMIRSGKQELSLADQNARPAVDFSYETREGVRRLSDLKGRVVVVDVWASWCGPCVSSIPHLVELNKKYQSAPFALIGLSVDENGWEDITPFTARFPEINYTVAVPHPKPSFQYSTIVDLKPLGDVSALPTVFVIDRSGRLAGKFVGAGRHAEVTALVEKLLQEGSTTV